MTAPVRPTYAWWNLVFLGYLAFGVVFRDVPLWLDLLVTIGSLAVFGWVWVWVERHPGAGAWWPAAAACVLTVAVTPVNGSATVYAVYAASFAALQLSARATYGWLAAATAALLLSSLVSSVPQPYLLFAALPPLISVWIVAPLILTERRRDRERRVHNARVEHLATLSERERIARDLHDLLGQTLTGIVVRSQLARRLAGADAERAGAEMETVETMAREALAEVRATVSGWRQVAFDDELTVARDALAAAGVELVETREVDLRLSPSAETALAMVLREAVTNVVRHARARRCTVALRSVDGNVVLEVADDGVGGGAREGNGLTGMRERIAALGGDVHRRFRDGTALLIELPATVAGSRP